MNEGVFDFFISLKIKANHIDDTLMLASEKAREAFLSLIHSRYCDPELDIESWYQYSRNMAKVD